MKSTTETSTWTRSVDSVCHKLRQPISVVRAYADLLEDEIAGPLNDGQREYVATLQRASDDLDRMVQELYDAAAPAPSPESPSRNDNSDDNSKTTA